jgi:hypothetical protein
MMNAGYLISLLITLPTCLVLVGCAARPQISYQRDVRPIFVGKCIDCHSPPYGEGYTKTGLDLGSYESLMKESVYGPVVVPGNSKKSPLNLLVEGRAGDLSRVLKRQHNPMKDDEIKIIRLWVEQGAQNN